METQDLGRTFLGRNGILYPMLVIAAVGVIVFSAFGVAAITGLIPTTESNTVQHQDIRPNTPPQSVPPPAKPAAPPSGVKTAGVVDTTNAVAKDTTFTALE